MQQQDTDIIDNPNRIVRPKEQCKLLGGISGVTLWRMRHQLPAEVRVSPGIKGRRLGDLVAFIDSRPAIVPRKSEARG